MSSEHGHVGLLPGQDTLGHGLGGTPVEIPSAVVLHLSSAMSHYMRIVEGTTLTLTPTTPTPPPPSKSSDQHHLHLHHNLHNQHHQLLQP